MPGKAGSVFSLNVPQQHPESLDVGSWLRFEYCYDGIDGVRLWNGDVELHRQDSYFISKRREL